MLGYAPNVSWLFADRPFAERLKAVVDLGFEAVEFGFPSQADLDALSSARQEYGLHVVLFNQDVPVWDAANRGYLADPARRGEFHAALDQALEMATRLGAEKIMLPAGVRLPELRREVQLECAMENLRAAAPMAARAQVLLTLEVLNPADNPGYFLTSSQDALDIVRQVAHPCVRFQMDTYHLQRLEGNLLGTLRDNMEWIGHIQFADEPGRHEPGTGTIGFGELEAAAEAGGYRGYIGLEYTPLASSAQALTWVPAARRSPAGCRRAPQASPVRRSE
ncbi:MAG: TIM barrel protein [Chloroflexi bacterium]|nr:TIM barrel protein [Chloroflexota bacterium]